MGKRVLLPETIDPIYQMLVAFQADGWGISTASQEVDYGEVDKKKIVLGATVTIHLTPPDVRR